LAQNRAVNLLQVRIVAILTKLVECFDPYRYRVRENAPSVAGQFEHEDDDEHEDD
jgi:hypothetical protein